MKTEEEILQETQRIQHEIDSLNEKTIKLEQQWLDQFCKIKEGSIVEFCGARIKIESVKVSIDLKADVEGYCFYLDKEDKKISSLIGFCDMEYQEMKVIKY